MKKIANPILVLRVSNMDGRNAIDEIEDVISREGQVWFGKYGRQIGGKRLGSLAPKNGAQKYVLLVYKEGSAGHSRYSYHWYELHGHQFKRPPTSLFPDYYKNFLPRIKSWLNLKPTKQNMPPHEDLITISSYQPLRESLALSMSSHFYCKLRH